MKIDILNKNEQDMLQTLIDGADHIVVTCHVNPDGDAIGSSLALADYLGMLGKSVTVACPDQYPDFLLWLPNSEKIIRYDKHPDRVEKALCNADLIFCLDYNGYGRLEAMADVVKQSTAMKIMIDHHPNPEIDTVLTISHPEMCSTCELLFRIVWQLGAFELMGKHYAAPIYCGMMTDTGGFTYNSTRPEIFFIISMLLTKGIDKDKIYRNVYNNYSEKRLRLIGYVLNEKLVVDNYRHASYYSLSREELHRFSYIKGDAEGLVNMPLQIKGHKLSISLREDSDRDNTVWVSLRSVDDFPCNEVAAQFFNGGGHLNASGGRLDCSIEEAEKVAQSAIKAFEKMLIG